MRLIDADALVKKLKGEEEYLDGGGARERADGITDAIMDVIEAPTIELESHWTPVTERLPEPDQEKRYLVTAYDYLWIARSLSYNGETWWDEDERGDLEDVVAWMPLPEPYTD